MIARKLLERLKSQPPLPEQRAADAPQVQLTARESDVLRLVARGYTYAEIADMEGISMHTVQMHIKHLYRKLEVLHKVRISKRLNGKVFTSIGALNPTHSLLLRVDT
jgi:DNA-binding CsgD family transcriptional regulator